MAQKKRQGVPPAIQYSIFEGGDVFVCPFCCADLARTEAGIPRKCPECDNIQFIDDPARGRLGDYCVACVEAFDQGRPNPIHADDDRVVRCDCFRPIPEPEEEEQKEGEPT